MDVIYMYMHKYTQVQKIIVFIGFIRNIYKYT